MSLEKSGVNAGGFVYKKHKFDTIRFCVSPQNSTNSVEHFLQE